MSVLDRARVQSNGDPAQPLLVVEDVRTRFQTPAGPLFAVDGVSLQIERGQTLGIVGESGSGKSVLARSIMGLLPVTASVSGRVEFDGKDLSQLATRELRRLWGREIAMVFQDPMTSLNPTKHVGRQLTDPLRRHLGLSKRAALDRAEELLDLVRIPEARKRLGQYPHEMSGGMRQRVMIAVALSCDPKLIIADEPTTALDVTVQKQILDLLSSVQQELGMSMILVTHDLGVVAGRTDRIAVMYAGRLVETGPTKELFRSLRHPYTEALLRSIPRIDMPSHTRLQTIPGHPPDMTMPLPGCRFAARCEYVQSACTQSEPPTSGDPGDHLFVCHHPIDLSERVSATTDKVLVKGAD